MDGKEASNDNARKGCANQIENASSIDEGETSVHRNDGWLGKDASDCES